MAGCNVIWAAKYFYPAGSGFKGHTHKCFQVFYITSGHGRMIIGEQEFDLCEDNMAIAQIDQYHRIPQIAEGELKLFDVKFTLSDDALAQQVQSLPMVMTLPDAPIRSFMSTIRKEFSNKYSFYNRIADSTMETMLWELIRIHNQEDVIPPDYPYIVSPQSFTGLTQKIATLVNQRYNCDISNESLAYELGYNKNYCCAVFRSGSGYTIGEYINAVRIHHAVNAIAYTDHSFAQIAQEVGFKNVYHFSRVFKKITGYTPSKIRELEREGIYHDLLINRDNPYRFDHGTATLQEQ